MEPVVFTMKDLFSLMLAACGAIVTISAAMVAIAKIVEKIKKPNIDQDKRISDLEESIKKINERLELGNKRFEMDCKRINENERSFKQATNVIIESLQALTAHAIDGNNINELKDSKKKLDTYLLNR